MKYLLDKLVDWWMSRCPHSDDDVAADLLEGAGPDQVRWCRRCGAMKLNEGRFRRPQPMWCEPYNSQAILRDAKIDLTKP